ncbi:tumor protein p53-inducible nuclear protein 2 [Pseudoliparis swirei]|uniref:tumor protein p53-inducible nuclear protein 2 n=1 Tax=Pseudoliparis swirei TaxID=2059687 RepID=UPI0024BE9CE3|nr:tumor protein p53-inducible nuclear protein 2 [Pseudoliparis swirei]
MFKSITRLLFGVAEEAPGDVKSAEVVEEGWLVVSHQEAGLDENNQGAEQTESQASSSALQGDTLANVESDISVFDPEPTVQSSSSSGGAIPSSVSQPRAVLEVTQLTCVQKAKAWADPHHMSRNAIQRQNRVRQGVQHQYYHLQQPGHRNLSH